MKRTTSTVALGLLLTLATACGSDKPAASPKPSSSAPAAVGTQPADVTAAKAEVTTAWTSFWNTSLPEAQRVPLVETGEALLPAIRFADKPSSASAAPTAVSATVESVLFRSASRAELTWTLLTNGMPVLPNATGIAVLEDGHWKVSKETFCALMALGSQGKPVPGC